MDLDVAMLGHLVIGGLGSLVQQELLVDGREDDGHGMRLFRVKAIERNAVQVLAQIDADLVANHVEMLARVVLQQRASLKGLLHHLGITNGVDVNMHDPLGVGRDVLRFEGCGLPYGGQAAPGRKRRKQSVSW